MDDLISREALFKKAQPDPETGEGFVWVQDICEAPAVEAKPVKRCSWCEPGHEKCATCRRFFDYYKDGGSDKCSAECYDNKCAWYEPVAYCPNCGAKMDGESDG